jgi:hypothetical protein
MSRLIRAWNQESNPSLLQTDFMTLDKLFYLARVLVPHL